MEPIKQYLINHPDVSEVILSGGDPLMQSDEKLQHLFDLFEELAPIKRIRIHTRLPVVLPSRITNRFLDILSKTSKKVIIVIHANHPNELNSEVANTLLLLKKIHVTLLNQSVLLQGINDHAETLVTLSHRLFECHTLPYYLHVLDF